MMNVRKKALAIRTVLLFVVSFRQRLHEFITREKSHLKVVKQCRMIPEECLESLTGQLTRKLHNSTNVQSNHIKVIKTD